MRHYGYYSNVSRGRRKKQNEDNLIACILEPDELSKGSRKNWARLIRKIYEVDPLICPKCNGQMRMVSFIEDQAVISKILKHLGLYLVRSTRPARAPPRAPRLDDSYSQIPVSDDHLHTDPEYSVDDYFS